MSKGDVFKSRQFGPSEPYDETYLVQVAKRARGMNRKDITVKYLSHLSVRRVVPI